VQADHAAKDERAGAIAEFLDKLLPGEWEAWDIDQRRAHLNAGEFQAVGTLRRDHVCIGEIWCELFGRRQGEMNTFNTKELHSLMKGIPGWERMNKLRRFHNYGPQRGYRRL